MTATKDIQNYYRELWHFDKNSFTAAMNIIGWGGKGSDIGNIKGEVYTYPTEMLPSLYVKQVYISPDSGKKLKIRITLLNEEVLGKVHTRIISYGFAGKVINKGYDKNKDFFIEYAFGGNSTSDNKSDQATMMYDLVIKWLKAINSEL